MMLVCSDLRSPISLNAIGMFCFVSKFTDYYTRWRHGIYLMENKTQTTLALVQYNTATGWSACDVTKGKRT